MIQGKFWRLKLSQDTPLLTVFVGAGLGLGFIYNEWIPLISFAAGYAATWIKP